MAEGRLVIILLFVIRISYINLHVCQCMHHKLHCLKIGKCSVNLPTACVPEVSSITEELHIISSPRILLTLSYDMEYIYIYIYI